MSADSEYYGYGPKDCKVVQIAVGPYPNDRDEDGEPYEYPGPGHRLYALCEDGSIWYSDMRDEDGWYWYTVPSPQSRRREEQSEGNLKP